MQEICPEIADENVLTTLLASASNGVVLVSELKKEPSFVIDGQLSGQLVRDDNDIQYWAFDRNPATLDIPKEDVHLTIVFLCHVSTYYFRRPEITSEDVCNYHTLLQNIINLIDTDLTELAMMQSYDMILVLEIIYKSFVPFCYYELCFCLSGVSEREYT